VIRERRSSVYDPVVVLWFDGARWLFEVIEGNRGLTMTRTHLWAVSTGATFCLKGGDL
jgi:hypothetical protein